MKKKKIIIFDKVYIPIGLYSSFSPNFKTRIKKDFTKVIVNPNFCPNFASSVYCPKVKKHGKGICRSCDMAKKTLRMWKKTKKWFILEKGNKPLISKVLAEINVPVKDKSVLPKLPLSCQYSLAYKKLDQPRKSLQIKASKEWLKKKYGQIVCPPRFGKTVLALIIASKLKTRTIIIAHQKELLDQFYNTFRDFTDIQDKAKIVGKMLIAINPRPETVGDLSVVLYTWQQFASKYGRKKLDKVRDQFGLLIEDESHRGNSDVYSQIISKFKARYKCGLTATPKRKDGLDFRQDHIIGPPTVWGGQEQLACKYKIVDTGWTIPYYKEWTLRNWNYFWNRIVKEEERNELISKFAIKDVKKGYKIIIPVKRIKHAEKLVESISKKVKTVMFIGATSNREKVSQEIRKGVYDVVVASAPLVSLGFDAPPMSCIYVNVGGPVFDRNIFYQQYSRIRTYLPNKKTPLIRIFNDDGDLCQVSLRMIKKEFKKMKFQPLKRRKK